MLKQIIGSYLEQMGSASEDQPDNNRLKGIYNVLNRRIEEFEYSRRKIRRLWYKAGIAAGILVFLSAGIYFAGTLKNGRSAGGSEYVGSEENTGKVMLTLADGRKIEIDASGNGLIANEGTATISKSSEEGLVYQSDQRAERNDRAGSSWNTLSIPKEMSYHIILSDGTGVWLNSSSSLRYPATFGGDERVVELTGEAYFEVSSNEKMPFKVMADGTEVNVLGTHFNVMAYPDESKVTTTLFEGSVKVRQKERQILLKPGEKAVSFSNQPGRIDVSEADLSDAIAWKNGYFKFNDENITDIMTKVARWYDIEVVYEGNMKDKQFLGTFSRNKSLKDLLTYLEWTGNVHFRTEGRRVIVME